MFGTWWLPTSPDRKVAGEVTLTQQGAWQLRVHGSLFEPTELASLSQDTYYETPVIEGRNADNQKVSLMKCWYSVSPWDSMAALPDETVVHEDWFFHSHAVGNVHVRPDTPIGGLTVRMDTLVEWAADMSTSSPRFTSLPDTAFGLCSAEAPEMTIHHSHVDQHSVSLKIFCERPYGIWSIGLNVAAQLNIEDDCTVDDAWKEWVFPLQNMLICLSLGYASLTSVTAGFPKDDGLVELHANTQRPRAEGYTRLRQHQMLATLSRLNEVGLDFESLMQRWFETRRDENYLGLCLRLLAGLHKHDSLTIDIQLLQAFRAAEAYYRHKTGAKPSQPSKQPLRMLIDCSGDIGEQVTSACEGFAEFAARQRGAVGHTGDAFIGNLGKGFMAVSRGMCWMLRRIYLVELGVPETEADHIIQAHQRYKYDLAFIQQSTP